MWLENRNSYGMRRDNDGTIEDNAVIRQVRSRARGCAGLVRAPGQELEPKQPIELGDAVLVPVDGGGLRDQARDRGSAAKTRTA